MLLSDHTYDLCNSSYLSLRHKLLSLFSSFLCIFLALLKHVAFDRWRRLELLLLSLLLSPLFACHRRPLARGGETSSPPQFWTSAKNDWSASALNVRFAWLIERLLIWQKVLPKWSQNLLPGNDLGVKIEELEMVTTTHLRSYGVMVSTLDFESSDPSSNLGRTSNPIPFCLFLMERNVLHCQDSL